MTFWVTVARATLAAALGLALIFQPDKARLVLVNFMGMFWLVSGIMSLRWGTTGQPSRQFLPILAGFVGVAAGLLVISRNIVGNLLSLELILNLLGAVMLLTGIVHISGGFHIGRRERHRTWASVILGAFEIVLGAAVLMTGSLEFSSLFYWALTTWALVGGFLLFAEALVIPRRMREPDAE